MATYRNESATARTAATSDATTAAAAAASSFSVTSPPFLVPSIRNAGVLE